MLDKIYVYNNLNVDVNSSSFYFVIWGICLGVMLGVFAALICRNASGAIVKAFLQKGVDSEDKALTLAELGLMRNPLYRYMLREGSSLRRYVLMSEDGYKTESAGKLKVFWYEKFLRDELPKKPDFSRATFYLPEEKRIGAEVRYPVEAHPIRNVILAAVFLLAAGLFATFVIPELFIMLDNFLTSI